MGKETELQEALTRAMKMSNRFGVISEGVVINTDAAETEFVCDVQIVSSDGQPTYYNVPLKVMIGSQASFIEIPQLKSNCLMGFRDGNQGRPQILFIDQVLKILVNCNNFIFNSGELGGMVKAKVLEEESNKDKAILDGLLAIINGAPIPEPGNGSPSALQAALKAALTGKQSGVWTDLEDPKITH